MVDINVKIPAIDKLIEYTASGIGAIARPIISGWLARKQGEALQIEAQSVGNAIQLIDEQLKDTNLRINGNISMDKKRKLLVTFQANKRCLNTIDVVELAADKLKDKKVNDHEVDHDFVAHFFSAVQDVTSDQLKQIWAKILARTVESPGCISLHTLAILKNMSRQDAVLFESVVQFAIGVFIFNDKRCAECLEEFPRLHSKSILRLSNIGLISPNTNIAVPYEIKSDLNLLFKFDNIGYFIVGKSENRRIQIPAYSISLQGTELSKIVRSKVNQDYLRLFAKFLDENGGHELIYGQIIEESGNKVIFDTTTLTKIIPFVD